MREDEKMAIANQELERIGRSFVAQTRKLKRAWSPKSRRKDFCSHTGFEGLWPENRTYHEYKFFEELIDDAILDRLVNPALHSLFETFEVHAFWPPSHSRTIVLPKTIANYEKCHDFEFIIDYGDERVGYLYDHPVVTGDGLYELLRKWRLNRIEVIDWSDTMSIEPWKGNAWLTYEGRQSVTVVSVRSFFEKHFPKNGYEELIAHLTVAVADASDLIGFQTIPSLSLTHLSDFKAEVLDEIALMRSDFKNGTAYQIDGVTSGRLLPQDLDHLDEVVFGHELYRSIAGGEDFAASFITSEYLRKSFGSNEQFDYTSVVSGYLKSVEQLEYNLMRQTLAAPGTDHLWIKRNGKRIAARHKVVGEDGRKQLDPDNFKRIKREKNWVNHVRFKDDLNGYFDTSLVPLTNLLHDNRLWWKLTDDGLSFVYDAVRSFAKDDRNGYFHKDNLRDSVKVTEIRNNVLAVLLLLIGGYETPGGIDGRRAALGVETNRFDELCPKLMEIPRSQSSFILTFDDAPIRAVRLFDQEDEHQNKEGHFDSRIVFVKVDSYRIEDYEAFVDSIRDEDVIEVSRDNVPTSVVLVLYDGQKRQIW